MSKIRDWLLITMMSWFFASHSLAQDIIVITSPQDVIEEFSALQWWGEPNRAQQLSAPYLLITSMGVNWRSNAKTLPVSTKKEIFYRSLLPLVLHANTLVAINRERLKSIQTQLASGSMPTPDEVNWLSELTHTLRIKTAPVTPGSLPSSEELKDCIAAALYKLDIIPAGLALGQAAYESGYGTSRFAAEGNALFGQWSFGGKGLVPEKQRKTLGDHRIAAFDWPFDSVRSYFINLNSHPAYEDFRKIRAELRRAQQPLDSLTLAQGLIRYSERGQAYVDTLRSIIRVNKLDIADNATLRDEPMRFIIGAADKQDAIRVRKEVDAMGKSGQLGLIIEQMALY